MWPLEILENKYNHVVSEWKAMVTEREKHGYKTGEYQISTQVFHGCTCCYNCHHPGGQGSCCSCDSTQPRVSSLPKPSSKWPNKWSLSNVSPTPKGNMVFGKETLALAKPFIQKREPIPATLTLEQLSEGFQTNKPEEEQVVEELSAAEKLEQARRKARAFHDSRIRESNLWKEEEEEAPLSQELVSEEPSDEAPWPQVLHDFIHDPDIPEHLKRDVIEECRNDPEHLMNAEYAENYLRNLQT
jgi:hypothetical protein